MKKEYRTTNKLRIVITLILRIFPKKLTNSFKLDETEKTHAILFRTCDEVEVILKYFMRKNRILSFYKIKLDIFQKYNKHFVYKKNFKFKRSYFVLQF